MMKNQRKYWVLVSVVLLAGCSLLFGQQEVRLVYANAQVVPSQYGGDRTSFKVHVENIGSMDNARVFIDYQSQLYGTSNTFQLTLHRIHALHATFGGGMFDLPDSFVVRYICDAGVFVDDNDGKKYHTKASVSEGAVGYGIGMMSCQRSYAFGPLHLDPTNTPFWAYLSLSGEVCINDSKRATVTNAATSFRNEVIAHIRRPSGGWVAWPCRYDRNMTGYSHQNDIEVWRFDIPWFMDLNQSWYFTMPLELRFTRETFDLQTGQHLGTFEDENFGFTYPLEFPLWLWGTPQVWNAYDNRID